MTNIAQGKTIGPNGPKKCPPPVDTKRLQGGPKPCSLNKQNNTNNDVKSNKVYDANKFATKGPCTKIRAHDLWVYIQNAQIVKAEHARNVLDYNYIYAKNYCTGKIEKPVHPTHKQCVLKSDTEHVSHGGKKISVRSKKGANDQPIPRLPKFKPLNFEGRQYHSDAFPLQSLNGRKIKVKFTDYTANIKLNTTSFPWYNPLIGRNNFVYKYRRIKQHRYKVTNVRGNRPTSFYKNIYNEMVNQRSILPKEDYKHVSILEAQKCNPSYNKCVVIPEVLSLLSPQMLEMGKGEKFTFTWNKLDMRDMILALALEEGNGVTCWQPENIETKYYCYVKASELEDGTYVPPHNVDVKYEQFVQEIAIRCSQFLHNNKLADIHGNPKFHNEPDLTFETSDICGWANIDLNRVNFGAREFILQTRLVEVPIESRRDRPIKSIMDKLMVGCRTWEDFISQSCIQRGLYVTTEEKGMFACVNAYAGIDTIVKCHNCCKCSYVGINCHSNFDMVPYSEWNEPLKNLLSKGLTDNAGYLPQVFPSYDPDTCTKRTIIRGVCPWCFSLLDTSERGQIETCPIYSCAHIVMGHACGTMLEALGKCRWNDAIYEGVKEIAGRREKHDLDLIKRTFNLHKLIDVDIVAGIADDELHAMYDAYKGCRFNRRPTIDTRSALLQSEVNACCSISIDIYNHDDEAIDMTVCNNPNTIKRGFAGYFNKDVLNRLSKGYHCSITVIVPKFRVAMNGRRDLAYHQGTMQSNDEFTYVLAADSTIADALPNRVFDLLASNYFEIEGNSYGVMPLVTEGINLRLYKIDLLNEYANTRKIVHSISTNTFRTKIKMPAITSLFNQWGHVVSEEVDFDINLPLMNMLIARGLLDTLDFDHYATLATSIVRSRYATDTHSQYFQIDDIHHVLCHVYLAKLLVTRFTKSRGICHNESWYIRLMVLSSAIIFDNTIGKSLRNVISEYNKILSIFKESFTTSLQGYIDVDKWDEIETHCHFTKIDFSKTVTITSDHTYENYNDSTLIQWDLPVEDEPQPKDEKSKTRNEPDETAKQFYQKRQFYYDIVDDLEMDVTVKNLIKLEAHHLKGENSSNVDWCPYRLNWNARGGGSVDHHICSKCKKIKLVRNPIVKNVCLACGSDNISEPDWFTHSTCSECEILTQRKRTEQTTLKDFVSDFPPLITPPKASSATDNVQVVPTSEGNVQAKAKSTGVKRDDAGILRMMTNILRSTPGVQTKKTISIFNEIELYGTLNLTAWPDTHFNVSNLRYDIRKCPNDLYNMTENDVLVIMPTTHNANSFSVDWYGVNILSQFGYKMMTKTQGLSQELITVSRPEKIKRLSYSSGLSRIVTPSNQQYIIVNVYYKVFYSKVAEVQKKLRQIINYNGAKVISFESLRTANNKIKHEEILTIMSCFLRGYMNGGLYYTNWNLDRDETSLIEKCAQVTSAEVVKLANDFELFKQYMENDDHIEVKDNILSLPWVMQGSWALDIISADDNQLDNVSKEFDNIYATPGSQMCAANAFTCLTKINRQEIFLELQKLELLNNADLFALSLRFKVNLALIDGNELCLYAYGAENNVNRLREFKVIKKEIIANMAVSHAVRYQGKMLVNKLNRPCFGPSNILNKDNIAKISAEGVDLDLILSWCINSILTSVRVGCNFVFNHNLSIELDKERLEINQLPYIKVKVNPLSVMELNDESATLTFVVPASLDRYVALITGVKDEREAYELVSRPFDLDYSDAGNLSGKVLAMQRWLLQNLIIMFNPSFNLVKPRYIDDVIEFVMVNKPMLKYRTLGREKTGDVIWLHDDYNIYPIMVSLDASRLGTLIMGNDRLDPTQKYQIQRLSDSTGSMLRTLKTLGKINITDAKFKELIANTKVQFGVFGSGKTRTYVEQTLTDNNLVVITRTTDQAIKWKATIRGCRVIPSEQWMNSDKALKKVVIDEGCLYDIMSIAQLVSIYTNELILTGDTQQASVETISMISGTHKRIPVTNLIPITNHLPYKDTTSRIGGEWFKFLKTIEPEIKTDAKHNTVSAPYKISTLSQGELYNVFERIYDEHNISRSKMGPAPNVLVIGFERAEEIVVRNAMTALNITNYVFKTAVAVQGDTYDNVILLKHAKLHDPADSNKMWNVVTRCRELIAWVVSDNYSDWSYLDMIKCIPPMGVTRLNVAFNEVGDMLKECVNYGLCTTDLDYEVKASIINNYLNLKVSIRDYNLIVDLAIDETLIPINCETNYKTINSMLLTNFKPKVFELISKVINLCGLRAVKIDNNISYELYSEISQINVNFNSFDHIKNVIAELINELIKLFGGYTIPTAMFNFNKIKSKLLETFDVINNKYKAVYIESCDSIEPVIDTPHDEANVLPAMVENNNDKAVSCFNINDWYSLNEDVNTLLQMDFTIKKEIIKLVEENKINYGSKPGSCYYNISIIFTCILENNLYDWLLVKICNMLKFDTVKTNTHLLMILVVFNAIKINHGNYPLTVLSTLHQVHDKLFDEHIQLLICYDDGLIKLGLLNSINQHVYIYSNKKSCNVYLYNNGMDFLMLLRRNVSSFDAVLKLANNNHTSEDLYSMYGGDNVHNEYLMGTHKFEEFPSIIEVILNKNTRYTFTKFIESILRIFADDLAGIDNELNRSNVKIKIEAFNVQAQALRADLTIKLDYESTMLKFNNNLGTIYDFNYSNNIVRRVTTPMNLSNYSVCNPRIALLIVDAISRPMDRLMPVMSSKLYSMPLLINTDLIQLITQLGVILTMTINGEQYNVEIFSGCGVCAGCMVYNLNKEYVYITPNYGKNAFNVFFRDIITNMDESKARAIIGEMYNGLFAINVGKLSQVKWCASIFMDRLRPKIDFTRDYDEELLKIQKSVKKKYGDSLTVISTTPNCNARDSCYSLFYALLDNKLGVVTCFNQSWWPIARLNEAIFYCITNYIENSLSLTSSLLSEFYDMCLNKSNVGTIESWWPKNTQLNFNYHKSNNTTTYTTFLKAISKLDRIGVNSKRLNIRVQSNMNSEFKDFLIQNFSDVEILVTGMTSLYGPSEISCAMVLAMDRMKQGESNRRFALCSDPNLSLMNSLWGVTCCCIEETNQLPLYTMRLDVALSSLTKYLDAVIVPPETSSQDEITKHQLKVKMIKDNIDNKSGSFFLSPNNKLDCDNTPSVIAMDCITNDVFNYFNTCNGTLYILPERSDMYKWDYDSIRQPNDYIVHSAYDNRSFLVCKKLVDMVEGSGCGWCVIQSNAMFRVVAYLDNKEAISPIPYDDNSVAEKYILSVTTDPTRWLRGEILISRKVKAHGHLYKVLATRMIMESNTTKISLSQYAKMLAGKLRFNSVSYNKALSESNTMIIDTVELVWQEFHDMRNHLKNACELLTVALDNEQTNIFSNLTANIINRLKELTMDLVALIAQFTGLNTGINDFLHMITSDISQYLPETIRPMIKNIMHQLTLIGFDFRTPLRDVYHNGVKVKFDNQATKLKQRCMELYTLLDARIIINSLPMAVAGGLSIFGNYVNADIKDGVTRRLIRLSMRQTDGLVGIPADSKVNTSDSLSYIKDVALDVVKNGAGLTNELLSILGYSFVIHAQYTATNVFDKIFHAIEFYRQTKIDEISKKLLGQCITDLYTCDYYDLFVIIVSLTIFCGSKAVYVVCDLLNVKINIKYVTKVVDTIMNNAMPYGEFNDLDEQMDGITKLHECLFKNLSSKNRTVVGESSSDDEVLDVYSSEEEKSEVNRYTRRTNKSNLPNRRRRTVRAVKRTTISAKDKLDIKNDNGKDANNVSATKDKKIVKVSNEPIAPADQANDTKSTLAVSTSGLAAAENDSEKLEFIRDLMDRLGPNNVFMFDVPDNDNQNVHIEHGIKSLMNGVGLLPTHYFENDNNDKFHFENNLNFGKKNIESIPMITLAMQMDKVCDKSNNQLTYSSISACDKYILSSDSDISLDYNWHNCQIVMYNYDITVLYKSIIILCDSFNSIINVIVKEIGNLFKYVLSVDAEILMKGERLEIYNVAINMIDRKILLTIVYFIIDYDINALILLSNKIVPGESMVLVINAMSEFVTDDILTLSVSWFSNKFVGLAGFKNFNINGNYLINGSMYQMIYDHVTMDTDDWIKIKNNIDELLLGANKVDLDLGLLYVCVRSFAVYLRIKPFTITREMLLEWINNLAIYNEAMSIYKDNPEVTTLSKDPNTLFITRDVVTIHYLSNRDANTCFLESIDYHIPGLYNMAALSELLGRNTNWGDYDLERLSERDDLGFIHVCGKTIYMRGCDDAKNFCCIYRTVDSGTIAMRMMQNRQITDEQLVQITDAGHYEPIIKAVELPRIYLKYVKYLELDDTIVTINDLDYFAYNIPVTSFNDIREESGSDANDDGNDSNNGDHDDDNLDVNLGPLPSCDVDEENDINDNANTDKDGRGPTYSNVSNSDSNNSKSVKQESEGSKNQKISANMPETRDGYKPTTIAISKRVEPDHLLAGFINKIMKTTEITKLTTKLINNVNYELPYFENLIKNNKQTGTMFSDIKNKADNKIMRKLRIYVANHTLDLTKQFNLTNITNISIIKSKPLCDRTSQTVIKFHMGCMFRFAKTIDGKIMLLNMANNRIIGGGFTNGAMAQEEELMRISSMYTFLKSRPDITNNFEPRTVYLCNNVTIFKDACWNSYRLSIPMVVDVISAQAPFKPCFKETEFGITVDKETEDHLLEVWEKIISAFNMSDCDHLILGPLGCGAFSNPVEIVINKLLIALANIGCTKPITMCVIDDDNSHQIHNPLGNVEVVSRLLRNNVPKPNDLTKKYKRLIICFGTRGDYYHIINCGFTNIGDDYPILVLLPTTAASIDMPATCDVETFDYDISKLRNIGYLKHISQMSCNIEMQNLIMDILINKEFDECLVFSNSGLYYINIYLISIGCRVILCDSTIVYRSQVETSVVESFESGYIMVDESTTHTLLTAFELWYAARYNRVIKSDKAYYTPLLLTNIWSFVYHNNWNVCTSMDKDKIRLMPELSAKDVVIIVDCTSMTDEGISLMIPLLECYRKFVYKIYAVNNLLCHRFYHDEKIDDYKELDVTDYHVVLIHHGGQGSMRSAFVAGWLSFVYPHSFDQMYVTKLASNYNLCVLGHDQNHINKQDIINLCITFYASRHNILELNQGITRNTILGLLTNIKTQFKTDESINIYPSNIVSNEVLRQRNTPKELIFNENDTTWVFMFGSHGDSIATLAFVTKLVKDENEKVRLIALKDSNVNWLGNVLSDEKLKVSYSEMECCVLQDLYVNKNLQQVSNFVSLTMNVVNETLDLLRLYGKPKIGYIMASDHCRRLMFEKLDLNYYTIIPTYVVAGRGYQKTGGTPILYESLHAMLDALFNVMINSKLEIFNMSRYDKELGGVIIDPTTNYTYNNRYKLYNVRIDLIGTRIKRNKDFDNKVIIYETVKNDISKRNVEHLKKVGDIIYASASTERTDGTKGFDPGDLQNPLIVVHHGSNITNAILHAFKRPAIVIPQTEEQSANSIIDAETQALMVVNKKADFNYVIGELSDKYCRIHNVELAGKRLTARETQKNTNIEFKEWETEVKLHCTSGNYVVTSFIQVDETASGDDTCVFDNVLAQLKDDDQRKLIAMYFPRCAVPIKAIKELLDSLLFNYGIITGNKDFTIEIKKNNPSDNIILLKISMVSLIASHAVSVTKVNLADKTHYPICVNIKPLIIDRDMCVDKMGRLEHNESNVYSLKRWCRMAAGDDVAVTTEMHYTHGLLQDRSKHIVLINRIENKVITTILTGSNGNYSCDLKSYNQLKPGAVYFSTNKNGEPRYLLCVIRNSVYLFVGDDLGLDFNGTLIRLGANYKYPGEIVYKNPRIATYGYTPVNTETRAYMRNNPQLSKQIALGLSPKLYVHVLDNYAHHKYDDIDYLNSFSFDQTTYSGGMVDWLHDSWKDFRGGISLAYHGAIRLVIRLDPEVLTMYENVRKLTIWNQTCIRTNYGEIIVRDVTVKIRDMTKEAYAALHKEMNASLRPGSNSNYYVRKKPPPNVKLAPTIKQARGVFNLIEGVIVTEIDFLDSLTKICIVNNDPNLIYVPGRNAFYAHPDYKPPMGGLMQPEPHEIKKWWEVKMDGAPRFGMDKKMDSSKPKVKKPMWNFDRSIFLADAFNPQYSTSRFTPSFNTPLSLEDNQADLYNEPMITELDVIEQKVDDDILVEQLEYWRMKESYESRKTAPHNGVIVETPMKIIITSSMKYTLVPTPSQSRPVMTKRLNAMFDTMTRRLYDVKPLRKHKLNINMEWELFKVYFNDKASTLLQSYQSVTLELNVQSIIDWVYSRKDYNKISREVVGVLQDCFITKQMNFLKAHEKLESLLKDKVDLNFQDQMIRAIVWQPKGIVALFAPLFKTIKERLKALLKGNIVYADGLTPTDVNQVLSNVTDCDNVIENDLEKQDRQTDDDLLDFEIHVYKQLGMHPDLADFWRSSHDRWRWRASNLSGNLHAMRLSGQATTAIGNVIVNLFCHRRLYSEFFAIIRLMLVLGDDNLMLSNGTIDLDGLSKQMKAYANMTCTVCQKPDTGIFLRYLVYKTNTGWQLGPDIVRLKNKFENLHGTSEPTDANIKARIMSYCVAIGGNKIIDTLWLKQGGVGKVIRWHDQQASAIACAKHYEITLGEVMNHYNSLINTMENAVVYCHEFRHLSHATERKKFNEMLNANFYLESINRSRKVNYTP